MTETNQQKKRISRRDAIKLIGAVTGATVLANLPSKWDTPEIASGVLPAHAQTSGLTILRQRFGSGNTAVNCGSTVCDELLTFHRVELSSTASGIQMRYTFGNVVGGSLGLTTPGSTTGVVNTVNGIAQIDVNYNGAAISYDLTWTFENPVDGSGSCTVTYQTANNNNCQF